MTSALTAGALLAAPALLLSGCANPNSVLFVTDTKIAIDADRAPPNVSIGYSRDETFIGPDFEEDSGGLPRVVGQLKSNLAPLNPQVEQVYATGQAATLVTRDSPSPLKEVCKPHTLVSPRKLAFFRTGANIGLKVVFTDQALESVTFGYKRKELSFIPLVQVESPDDANGEPQVTPPTDKMKKDIYGSVIAFINVITKSGPLFDSSVRISQFFATGCPAEQLANTNQSIRDAFKVIAAEAATQTSVAPQK
jgi:hypothetical protein